ncbi:MAG: hypothetical protein HOJ15_01795 [Candidatus Jacksonbacteria bacterium]|nr:hypothetical protein [Candidatus Jacksonbacteria bacterium]MBT6034645.1 hypothetical protein [Candidatus Jacksonbacteria bacterium]MBT6301139.1 hypothetical protein [Candidatus Jacksonbacteria bacterium]
MRLSALQKFILKQCFITGGRVGRAPFNYYFEKRKLKHPQKVLTKSFESLIDRGLLRGFGKRTPRKWFIESVSLTPQGKKEAWKVLEEQQMKLIK